MSKATVRRTCKLPDCHTSGIHVPTKDEMSVEQHVEVLPYGFLCDNELYYTPQKTVSVVRGVTRIEPSETLIKHYKEGWTFRRIAEYEGIAIGTAHAHVTRAIKEGKLKKR